MNMSASNTSESETKSLDLLTEMNDIPLGSVVSAEKIQQWNSFSSNHGGDLLHLAVSHGDNPSHQAALLIENGFNINRCDQEGRSPLTRVFSRPDPEAHELVKFLLSKGADPSCVSKNNLYPLAMACRSGRFHYFPDLIEAGANPEPQRYEKPCPNVWEWSLNDFNSKSFPTLHAFLPPPVRLCEPLLKMAIQKSFSDSVEILWGMLGRPTLIGKESILHLACRANKIDRLLSNQWIARWIEAGADETVVNEEGQTWMEEAEKRLPSRYEDFLAQRAEGHRRLLNNASPERNLTTHSKMRL